jgi:oligopeptide transport system substrate-binding protein
MSTFIALGLVFCALRGDTARAVTPAADSAVFRFHLFMEPSTLDPQAVTSATGNFVFNALYKGLFSYHGRKGLRGEGARTCRRTKHHLTCTLNPDHKWSNGERVTAHEYVATFRRLIDPKLSSPQSDLIFTLKNARSIWAGRMDVISLGVKALAPHILEFEFETEDSEFEYKLISPTLAPLPPGGFKRKENATEMITSGPYIISEWRAGAWIHMKRNPQYPDHGTRTAHPDVEAVFVENDATALSLYEAGRLTFLRRVVGADIERLRHRPGFQQIPMARFDYIGFGPALKDYPHVREALVKSVDFPQFLKLFDTRTAPGCPSLPAHYMDRAICQKFQPESARQLLKNKNLPKKIEYQFSRMGGDDIARAAEFFQGQWRKNLGLEIELHGQEQGVYVRQLKVAPPAIFRRGVSLDRPSCLAALEIFGQDNPENFIHFDDPEYDRLLKSLNLVKGESVKRRLCRQAVERLLTSNRLIPLGEMYFTIMASPDFTGWDLNELNQLDLSELTATPKGK